MDINGIVDLNMLDKLLSILDDTYRLIRINLKKKWVRDVYRTTIDDYFNLYIKNYKYVLTYPYINTHILNTIGVYDERFFMYQSRIKRQESINYKLFKKCNENGGTYKLIDVLNDLYGVRFKIKGYNNIKNDFEMNTDFNRYYSDIKFLRRIVNGGLYKADHIYFRSRESNWIFPIELQIWDFEDCDTNDESHKLYKRDYIYWL